MTDWRLHPLRQWREAQGYTLEEAAPLVGARRQSWHDWEKGRRVPTVEFMSRIFRLTHGSVRADHFIWPFGYPDLGGRSVRELFDADRAEGNGGAGNPGKRDHVASAMAMA